MTILKGKEPKDVIAIFVIALVISILVYLAVITVYPKETYYFNKPSINETVKKIDVQLNFQVYVNDKLVVNKWNNGLTENFIKIIKSSLQQSGVYLKKENGADTENKVEYFEVNNAACSTCNDKITVKLGTTTYSSNVAFDMYSIASSEYVSFTGFPSKNCTVNADNATITYEWSYTATSSFTFYEVGIYRNLFYLYSGNWKNVNFLLVYEDIPDGVSVETDDVVKIKLIFVCEKSFTETFTVKFASSFLDKIFYTNYNDDDDVYIWEGIQYRWIEIGEDCFSVDSASSGEICSTNYVELHHETRTYYTNADKTQCTVELKVTYTPDTNVPVKEICWGFSNTNIGYCKKFDTTLQKDVPYVIKVLITFPTG